MLVGARRDRVAAVLATGVLATTGVAATGEGTPAYLATDVPGDANAVSALDEYFVDRLDPVGPVVAELFDDGDWRTDPAQYAPADLLGVRLATVADHEGRPTAVELRIATAAPPSSPGRELAWTTYVGLGECQGAIQVITDGTLDEAFVRWRSAGSCARPAPLEDSVLFQALAGPVHWQDPADWTVRWDAGAGETVVTIPLGTIPAPLSDHFGASSSIRIEALQVRQHGPHGAVPAPTLDRLDPDQPVVWQPADGVRD